MTLHTDTPERFEWALEALEGGFPVTAKAPAARPLVHQRVTA